MKFENELKINSIICHYNHKKYWRMRFKLYDEKLGRIKRKYYMLRLKKMEAYNCASLGVREKGGSVFCGEPHLPHGIRGIFISDYVKIGENATIFQQVTIGLKDYNHGLDQVPVIGDNVTIGAGAKVIGPIRIGNNVSIGANAVVTKDIPDNAVVVGNPGIIKKYK